MYLLIQWFTLLATFISMQFCIAIYSDNNKHKTNNTLNLFSQNTNNPLFRILAISLVIASLSGESKLQETWIIWRGGG